MLAAENLPLAGMLVLDFSQFLAGPVAALRLADLGARVVKIERPGTGEIGRTLAFGGRWRDGDTLSFHAMNRNKEAVVADLKDPDDLEAVKRLVARADVLIQNFRPGVMERLGLDHASVAQLNPGLVYASASGYGAEGPWAGRPGQDLLAQSVSGLPWVNSATRPVPVGLAVADHLMSCHIAEGVTALLVRKARTGRGGLVETSLLEAMLDLQFTQLTARMNPGGTRSAEGADGLYRTGDGWLAVAGVSVERFRQVLEAAEATGVTQGARASAGEVLSGRSTREWLELLADEGIGCSPVLTLEQLLEHEAFTALEMVQTVERPPREPEGAPVQIRTTRSPIRIDGQCLTATGAAPRLGQQGHVSALVGPDPRSH